MTALLLSIAIAVGVVAIALCVVVIKTFRRIHGGGTIEAGTTITITTSPEIGPGGEIRINGQPHRVLTVEPAHGLITVAALEDLSR